MPCNIFARSFLCKLNCTIRLNASVDSLGAQAGTMAPQSRLNLSSSCSRFPSCSRSTHVRRDSSLKIFCEACLWQFETSRKASSLAASCLFFSASSCSSPRLQRLNLYPLHRERFVSVRLVHGETYNHEVQHSESITVSGHSLVNLFICQCQYFTFEY